MDWLCLDDSSASHLVSSGSNTIVVAFQDSYIFEVLQKEKQDILQRNVILVIELRAL